ncbi:hypothetical protein ACNS7O_09990 [Haloferacaceae archaeon DSL9]
MSTIIQGPSMLGPLLIFLVNLLIGTIAIHTGAKLVIDRDTPFSYAAVTALIGAIVWGLVSLFVGWIPLIGPILTLLAWIGVINWRYPGGWGAAIGIALVAWLIAIVVLWLLATVGIIGFDALGVPS